jgi:hypothetical protein
MLSAAELAAFEDLGFVWIRAAFSPDEARRMRAVVWHELARRYAIQERDPSTWLPKCPAGLKASRRHRAFEPIGAEPLSTAANSLLGTDAWSRPRQWGQVLVTFPDADERWTLPHRLWHVDFRYDVTLPMTTFGLKLFALFGDAVPHGGGTLLIARSHRIVTQFLTTEPVAARRDFRDTRLRFMGSHHWLKALASPEPDPGREARFMDHEENIDGIPARVVEVTGQAGDVLLTHPWVVHHVAPNTSTQPRFMRAQSIYRRHPRDLPETTRVDGARRAVASLERGPEANSRSSTRPDTFPTGE